MNVHLHMHADTAPLAQIMMEAIAVLVFPVMFLRWETG